MAEEQPGSSSEGEERMAHLARALEVFRQWREAPEGSVDELLARNPDLEGLLEPLIESGGEVPSDDEERERLGDFELLREIGRGGMGVVYEARDSRLGRRVALKVLTPQPDGDRALARFQREATTVASLAHPGIVELFGVGEDGGCRFFAMELIHGVSLDRVLDQLRRRPERSGFAFRSAVDSVILSPDTDSGSGDSTGEPSGMFDGSYVQCAARIVEAVARAAGHAHAQEVLHRDIKPANVMVTGRGRIVLTDFGLARSGEAPSITVTGQFAGTPYYVAPEQALGDWGHVGPAADVFSLGATLYELLLLERPFEGASAQQVLQQICDPAPVDGRRLSRRVPADLVAIVLKALEKGPQDRYQNGEELADDLRAFLEVRPVAATRPGPIRRALRWARREPIRAALAATLGLGIPALAGMGGYVLTVGPAIDAGEEELERRAWERRLAEAYAFVFQDELEAGVEAFDRLLDERPDDLDAAVGVAVHAARRGGGGDMEAWLDRHPQIEARSRVIRTMVRGPVSEEGMTPAPDAPPAEYHAAGIYWFLSGQSSRRPDWMKRGLDLLLRANLLSTRPSEIYLTSIAHCAEALHRVDVVDQACHGLERHFSDSPFALISQAYVLRRHRPEVAMDCARRAVAIAPDSPFTVGRLAALHSELGDDQAARAGFERVLAVAPTSSVALTNLASIDIREGHLEAAEGWVDRLLEMNAQDSFGLQLRGRLALRRDQLPTALEWFEKAHAAAPWRPDIAADLGNVLRQVGRPDDAIELLEPLLQDANPDAGVFIQYAQALVQKGRTEDAYALLQRAPVNPRVLRLRAALACQQGLWADGVAGYVAAAKLEPLPIPDTVNRMIALTEVGDWDAAAVVIESAKVAHPGDARIHDWVMHVLLHAEQIPEAVGEVRRFAAERFRGKDFSGAVAAMESKLPLPPPTVLPEEQSDAFHADLKRYREAAAGR